MKTHRPQHHQVVVIRNVSDAVSIPVIANGGAGTLQDFLDALEKGHVSAVAASSIFNFTDQSLIKSRRFLRNNNINVREG